MCEPDCDRSVTLVLLWCGTECCELYSACARRVRSEDEKCVKLRHVVEHLALKIEHSQSGVHNSLVQLLRQVDAMLRPQLGELGAELE